MSCKHCEPIGGEVTPLVELGDVTVTIKSSRIVLEAHGGIVSMSKAIDFCPICGESLRPFGPAWARDLER